LLVFFEMLAKFIEVVVAVVVVVVVVAELFEDVVAGDDIDDVVGFVEI